MKKSLLILGSLFSVQAMAYVEGTFICENVEGVPANKYVVKNVNMDGVQVPFVELQRFYRTTINNEAQIVETKMKGIATVAQTSYESAEYLILGTLQLEFKDGQITGCLKTK